MELPVEDFPIDHYDQSTSTHLPTDKNQLLLTKNYQINQLQQFYSHYYSTEENGLSPWSESFVNAIFPVVQSIEQALLAYYSNYNKSPQEQHYGENFKPHPQQWLNKIQHEIQLSQLSNASFNANQRAIITKNTFARHLPESSPDFFNASLAGQGFPFDNLQESALWLGTPVYILGTTKHKAWSLVLTPDGYIAWINSEDVAYVTEDFIQQWQKTAHHLLAITKTETSILNLDYEFQALSYIGSVFPLLSQNTAENHILIPIKTENHQAKLVEAIVSNEDSSLMPLEASVKNMEKIIQQLQARPYGWGGAFFLNDCSQELKSLFAPFGIWLPRNSSHQSQIGNSVDLSSSSLDERLNILKQKGHPLLTLIYVKGHIMLYTGKEQQNSEEVAMTYQNVWGLAPENGEKRFVIGQSVFLPLLKQYPEQPTASSIAGKDIFKLIYLDQIPTQLPAVATFAKQFRANIM